jgi:hypothetical protein
MRLARQRNRFLRLRFLKAAVSILTPHSVARAIRSLAEMTIHRGDPDHCFCRQLGQLN